MGRRLKSSLQTPTPLTQLELWQEFLQKHYLEYPALGDLVRIMLVIPPNSGWIERALSILEQICQKRRNRLKVKHMRNMFLLSVLKLDPKICVQYEDEVKIYSKMSKQRNISVELSLLMPADASCFVLKHFGL